MIQVVRQPQQRPDAGRQPLVQRRSARGRRVRLMRRRLFLGALIVVVLALAALGLVLRVGRAGLA
jgi:hypothetical protein